MMFQCNKAVWAVSGKKDQRGRKHGEHEQQPFDRRAFSGGLMAWFGPFSSPGAGPKGSSVGSIFASPQMPRFGEKCWPRADQHS
jgi:hypothetical protein